MRTQCNNENMIEKKIGSIACSSTGRLVEKNVIARDCEEDLIEKKGVCSEDELETLETGNTWTQMFIPEVLCIPPQKPDVEQVMTITSNVEIISQRVIKTPIAEDTGVLFENYEGTKLTGRKLIIEGILRQKIIYTANVTEQSVHSAHFDVPFSAFIVLPKDTSLVTRYKIEPCIEDIFVCRVSKRQIFKNVTLFIKVTERKC